MPLKSLLIEYPIAEKDLQIPQPIHRRSDIKAIFDSGVTSMQSLPVRTTGQDFLHSCRHFCRTNQPWFSYTANGFAYFGFALQVSSISD